jgi:iron complex transport system substrate-binding protein
MICGKLDAAEKDTETMYRLLILLLCTFMTNANAEVQVIDDTGHQLTLAQPAQRIISLAPHVTEILYSIGAGEKIVGTVNHSDYPEAAKRIPIIGGYNRVSIEAIVELQPDLIIGWHEGNPVQQIEALRALNIPVYATYPKKVTDIGKMITQFGRLTGNDESAKIIAQKLISEFLTLQTLYQNQPAIKVYYEIWRQPLLTASGQHFIGQIITLCGGQNIFQDLQALTPKISTESVLVANPQVMICSLNDDQFSEWKQNWQQYQGIQAIKLDNLFSTTADFLHRPTLRLLQGAKEVCQILDSVRMKKY